MRGLLSSLFSLLKELKMRKMTVILLALVGAVFSRVNAEESLQESKKVHLIWEVKKESVLEEDWIREVLSEVDYDEVFDEGNYDIMMNNSIIVISMPEDARPGRYFKELRSRGYKFGVIQISDETCKVSDRIYAGAKFVLRNYWDEKFLSARNVFPLPLGYQRGLWENVSNKQTPNIDERDYVWSFAGQLDKSTRMTMAKYMREIPDHFVYETATFLDPKALSAGEYRDLLLDTIFVPCPRGTSSLDTYRLVEALECGCIPIVEKRPENYFAKLFGNFPFLAVDHWSEAPMMINELLSDRKKLEKLRLSCNKWWINYKKQLQKETAKKVSKGFGLEEPKPTLLVPKK